MIDYNILFSFALAYLVTFAAVPIVRVIAFKINAVDVPRDNRRMHKRPVPRLGGTAIFLGFVVSAACFTSIIDQELIGIFLGSSIIVLVGMFDDRKPLPPLVKLLGQIAAAAVVIGFGVRIHMFTNPLPIGDGYVDLSYLSIPITFVWIIIMTNAINLIDGLDGLATSISGISALALVFLCIILTKSDMAILLVGVAGACFGFFPYNQHPAKIFMGDSGALFLGFILATLSIQGFFKSYAVITFIIPVIVLALPIFDTSFAILRRVVNKKGIMSADRGHLHHRLVDLGFSQREAVVILATFSALLSITAILITTKGFNRASVLLVVLILFAVSIRIYYKNKSIAKEYLQDLEESRSEEHEED